MEKYKEWLCEKEQWVDIQFKGVKPSRYRISSFGRIDDGITGAHYAEYESNNGYNYALIIFDNGNVKLTQMSLIVALSFYNIPDELINKPIRVIHIDGNTGNNNAINLKFIEDVEEWKVIDTFNVKPNMYAISNHGRIKNIIDDKILKVSCIHLGYVNANIMMKNGKCNKHLLHRLVAHYFVKGYAKDKVQVNHIDGNKSNNHYMNLDWTTAKENKQHAKLAGLMCIGEDSPLSKLSNRDVELIAKSLLKHNGDIRKVEDELKDIIPNISYRCIQHIRLCHTRTDITNKYFTKERFLNAGQRYDHPCGENSSSSLMSNEVAERICELLVTHFGNALWVYRQLREECHDEVSLRMVNHIKNKETWINISDKYFTKESLNQLTIHKIEIICETLIKYDMDADATFDELSNMMRYLTKRFIYDIRQEFTYREISQSYF